MKKLSYVKNELAFTLIEMMIVLMIISILLLIAIPNMTNNNEVASKRGCDATIQLLQAQVGAYYVEKQKYPEGLNDLTVGEKPYTNRITCPDGKELVLDTNKKVVLKPQ